MESRARLLAAFVVLAVLALAPTAQAQLPDPSWTCAGSALRVSLGGNTLLEPVTANDTSRQCRDSTGSTPTVEQGTSGLLDPLLPTIRVSAEGLFAKTDLSREGAPRAAQFISTRSGAASATVEIRSGGDEVLTLEIEGINSRAFGACSGTTPTFRTDFDAVTIKLNGNELSLDEALDGIADALSQAGLDPLVKIEIGKVIDSGDAGSADESHTIRALEVQLLGAPEPLADIVVGEATVDRHGGVCAEPACPVGSLANADGVCVFVEFAPCPPNALPNDDGQCVLIVTQPCPEGSTANAGGQCVVPSGPTGCPENALPNGLGECVLVVLGPCPPNSVANPLGQCVLISPDQATGGILAPLEQAAGPCRRRRFGTQAAILGSARRDRITGTNRSDRIFALGGADRVSGGRGNDCLDGGSGNDNLDGSNGNDFLFGGTGRDIMNGGTGSDRLEGASGNDKLTGGSGNDRQFGGAGRDKLSGGLGRDLLDGGAGRDYIEAGPGRDVIRGGSGNDAINVAESGAQADLVDCGPGRDVVRIDSRDRVRNCERVLVLRAPRR